MRIYHTLICLIFVGLGWSQNDLSIFEIAEAEGKIANLRNATNRNAETGNYDLQYHRLEFAIDPAVNFIEGSVTSHFIALEESYFKA